MTSVTHTYSDTVSSKISNLQEELKSAINNVFATKALTVGTDNTESLQNTQAADSPVLPLPKPSTDLLLVLQGLLVKLDQEGIKTNKEDVHRLAEQNKQHHDEVLKSIQDAAQALKKSEESGKRGKIFGWICAAATVVAGVALMATGAGAVAGGVMLVMSADMMVGLATGTSATGILTEKLAQGLSRCGLSSPADVIVSSVIITILMVALSGGASAMSSTATKGAALAAKSSSTTATQSAGQATNAIGKTANTVSQSSGNFHQLLLRNSTTIQSFSNLTIGISEMGSAAFDIAKGIYNKQAADAEVEKTEIETAIIMNKSYIEQAIENLKALTVNTESTLNNMLQTIDQQQQTNQALIREIA